MTIRRSASLGLLAVLGGLAGLGLITTAAHAAAGPALGRSVQVGRLAGTVLVKVPRHAAYVPLANRRIIPVGSTVDTSHGRVRLVAARGTTGNPESGQFNGGQFVVT